ncbi:MAG: saccharopine dehydrogenase C-terminal domain-containing protein [Bacteroidota bacterium]
MQRILVLGAGLSSSYLIHYLLNHAQSGNLYITVADSSAEAAQQKVTGFTNAQAVAIDVNDVYELSLLVKEHDVVISLMPPALHVRVAKACIEHKRNLITASYVTDEMRELHTEAIKANVLLLNEAGLDPGIDHMSAMQLIHRIQKDGGVVKSFRSYTGGLIAPEFDNNPWHYKFKWNPRNVVLAGQATAAYMENGELKYIPPSRIFTQTQSVKVQGTAYEGYANRDSLSYIKPYGIESSHTVLRGTLRINGYCSSWNHLVRLGLTDDTFAVKDAHRLTYRQLLSAFTPGSDLNKLEQRVCDFLSISQSSESFSKLYWLGLFADEPIAIREGTPAQILQLLLQQKWKLNKGDLDQIVMLHSIQYEINGQLKIHESSLVVKGENEQLTAMAKTVGLPMGIAARLLLEGKLRGSGVQIPIHAELYEPVLDELKRYGIVFMDEQ